MTTIQPGQPVPNKDEQCAPVGNFPFGMLTEPEALQLDLGGGAEGWTPATGGDDEREIITARFEENGLHVCDQADFMIPGTPFFLYLNEKDEDDPGDEDYYKDPQNYIGTAGFAGSHYQGTTGGLFTYRNDILKWTSAPHGINDLVLWTTDLGGIDVEVMTSNLPLNTPPWGTCNECDLPKQGSMSITHDWAFNPDEPASWEYPRLHMTLDGKSADPPGGGVADLAFDPATIDNQCAPSTWENGNMHGGLGAGGVSLRYYFNESVKSNRAQGWNVIDPNGNQIELIEVEAPS